MSDPHGDGRRPENRPTGDEEIILEAVEMLNALDDIRPEQMTALFYQHWFEQLSMTARDLLRILGHDAGNHKPGST